MLWSKKYKTFLYCKWYKMSSPQKITFLKIISKSEHIEYFDQYRCFNWHSWRGKKVFFIHIKIKVYQINLWLAWDIFGIQKYCKGEKWPTPHHNNQCSILLKEPPPPPQGFFTACILQLFAWHLASGHSFIASIKSVFHWT